MSQKGLQKIEFYFDLAKRVLYDGSSNFKIFGKKLKNPYTNSGFFEDFQ